MAMVTAPTVIVTAMTVLIMLRTALRRRSGAPLCCLPQRLPKGLFFEIGCVHCVDLTVML
jgi:hypothetical protein